MRNLPPLPARLSHAYIITGGSGETRRAYAGRLAAAYQCTGAHPPCGECPACRKVAKGIHPDVMTLTTLEKKREIPVDDARAARQWMYVVPNEGRRKVCLVDPADALNAQAQAALLKVLEDGPARGAFLLLCEQPGQLLETVRSRCETIALPPEEPEADPELARRGAELAELLLHGSEWQLAQYLAALESAKAKPKPAEALDLFAAAGEAVRRRLGNDRRAVPILQALETLRGMAAYNPSVGHMCGWLCSEVFH